MKSKLFHFLTAVLLFAAPLARADIVTTANSTGAGSLPAVVAAAATDATITFAAGLSGLSIQLDSTLLLNKNLTIDASALPGGIRILGNGRVLEVTAGQTVVLRSLEMRDGFDNDAGAGIYNAGTLTLDRCTLANNGSVGEGSYRPLAGGAIYNTGTLTLNQCTVASNVANAGAAIHNHTGASLTVNQSTLAGNEGNFGTGGIRNLGTLTLNNTLLAGNFTGSIFDPNLGNSGTLTLQGNNLTSGNPLLASLGNYGGPTQTMPPLIGSLAIDAGGDTPFITDQRGFTRVIGPLDLGAVESVEARSTATTLPPTGISNASVTFNAAVIPGSQLTRAWFQWGHTTNYGSATPGITLSSGSSSTNVVESLNNLTAGAPYHVRAVASNAVGMTFGADWFFWLPAVALNGANPLTNECHAPSDPGVTASASPVAFNGGSFHTLALRRDATVGAWGGGLLGDNSNIYGWGQSIVPPNATDIIAIGAGTFHSLALKSNGTVIAWGRNQRQQCNVPGDATNVIAVAGGLEHSVAARGDGSVLTWGSPSTDRGQTQVPAAATNIIAVDAGDYHNVALQTNGTVIAWGANTPENFIGYGQCNVPAEATNVIAVAAGNHHSLALRNDGTVLAWGRTDSGQCTVPASATNIIAISAAGQHSLALRRDGVIIGWGENSDGRYTFPAAATNIVHIATGFKSSYALRADGAFFQSIAPAGVGMEGFPDTVTKLNLSAVTSGNLDVDTPGSYLVHYTVTNALGATGTISRTVVVADRAAPVITLVGANPLYWTLGVPFVDPGAAANDACVGSVNVTPSGQVNTAILGTNTLTYQASDAAGNSRTANRIVIVTGAPALSGFTAQVIGINPISGARTLVLSASVNPNGLAGAAWFQYGLNPSYPGLTPAANFVASFAGQPQSATLSNLLAGVTYHYRVVATNSAGLTTGADQTFYVPPDHPVGDTNGDGVVSQAELDTVYANYLPTSPWLALTNVAGLGGTNVTFALEGSLLGNYTVEYSTNLADWFPLGSAIPRYSFTDTNAFALPPRYYRLRYP